MHYDTVFLMKKIIALLIAGIALSGIVHAETLLGWDLDARTVTDDAPSTANASDILAGTLSSGAGTLVVDRVNGLATLRIGASTTIGEAIANDTYWKTTVTATSGFAFTPSTFVAIFQQNASEGTVIELRSSADNFATPLGSTALDANIDTPISYDLSSTLSGSYETLEFRLYFYNAGNPDEYSTLYMGKIGITDGATDFGFAGTTSALGQRSAPEKRGYLFLFK